MGVEITLKKKKRHKDTEVWGGEASCWHVAGLGFEPQLSGSDSSPALYTNPGEAISACHP